jgi:NAD(P) transhydrogenase subunit alpha
MTIGVLKEPSDETRVSLLPEAVATLSKKGISILIENGAGENAFADDESYQKVGAQVKPRAEVIQSSDIILSIQSPGKNDPIAIGIQVSNQKF